LHCRSAVQADKQNFDGSGHHEKLIGKADQYNRTEGKGVRLANIFAFFLMLKDRATGIFVQKDSGIMGEMYILKEWGVYFMKVHAIDIFYKVKVKSL
jgi:hypothetical protein